MNQIRVRLTRDVQVESYEDGPYITWPTTGHYPWMYMGADQGEALLVGATGTIQRFPLNAIQFEDHPA